jgi:hypothetical protein
VALGDHTHTGLWLPVGTGWGGKWSLWVESLWSLSPSPLQQAGVPTIQSCAELGVARARNSEAKGEERGTRADVGEEFKPAAVGNQLPVARAKATIGANEVR